MFSETCHFIKKRLQHKSFPVKFAQFLRTPFFTEHLRWLLLSFLKWKKWRNVFILIYSQENASYSVLFSTVAGMRAYSFIKKGRHLRCVLWNLWSFTEISILQKTAWQLLPISSNISDISLALLIINQLVTAGCLSRTSKAVRKSCSEAFHSVCLKNI